MARATPHLAAPRLRALDIVRVTHPKHGLVTVVNDGEGVGTSVTVPPPLDAALDAMDGRRGLAAIASAAARATGEIVSMADVAELVERLDEALLLDNQRFRDQRRAAERAFAALAVRDATHAGGAYHADARRLAAFIDRECLSATPEAARLGEVAALIAPHMDLWRAAAGYGRAYGTLRSGLGDRAETFFLLGTCHAGMRSPFALTKKAFATPFGQLATDGDIVDELAERSGFDVFEDEYQHRAEHSIEFQAVFLRHVLGAERSARARIVPILCGLGRAQAERSDPALDAQSAHFLDALGEVVERLDGKAVVIAGADLAHVGPRFGDGAPLDARQREALRARDGTTLSRALDLDARGFFEDTTSDLDRRRVCGVGPIYTLLRLTEALGLARGSGAVAGYTQHVDPKEGSIVSHASLAFSRPG